MLYGSYAVDLPTVRLSYVRHLNCTKRICARIGDRQRRPLESVQQREVVQLERRVVGLMESRSYLGNLRRAVSVFPLRQVPLRLYRKAYRPPLVFCKNCVELHWMTSFFRLIYPTFTLRSNGRRQGNWARRCCNRYAPRQTASVAKNPRCPTDSLIGTKKTRKKFIRTKLMLCSVTT